MDVNSPRAAAVLIDEEDQASPTPSQRLSLYFRTVLCGISCFPMAETTDIAKRFSCHVTSAGEGLECRMTTWVPIHHLFVMLVGTQNGDNKVIVCCNGDVYTMSPSLEVRPMPAGVVILGTCTIDDDGTFRVLVYDGCNLPVVNNQEEHLKPDTDTQERYARLRSFFPLYFNQSKAARTTFHLQWLGFEKSAKRFLAGEIDVGHSVGGLISTNNDAMRPTRPVRILVPENTIQQFK
jgi:hypothetical protein